MPHLADVEIRVLGNLTELDKAFNTAIEVSRKHGEVMGEALTKAMSTALTGGGASAFQALLKTMETSSAPKKVGEEAAAAVVKSVTEGIQKGKEAVGSAATLLVDEINNARYKAESRGRKKGMSQFDAEKFGAEGALKALARLRPELNAIIAESERHEAISAKLLKTETQLKNLRNRRTGYDVDLAKTTEYLNAHTKAPEKAAEALAAFKREGGRGSAGRAVAELTGQLNSLGGSLANLKKQGAPSGVVKMIEADMDRIAAALAKGTKQIETVKAAQDRILNSDRNKMNDKEVSFVNKRSKEQGTAEATEAKRMIADRNKMNDLEVTHIRRRATERTAAEQAAARQIDADKNAVNNMEIRYINRRSAERSAAEQAATRQAEADRNAANNMEVRFLNQRRTMAERVEQQQTRARLKTGFERRVFDVTKDVTGSFINQYAPDAKQDMMRSARAGLEAMRAGFADASDEALHLDKLIEKISQDLFVSIVKTRDLAVAEQRTADAAIANEARLVELARSRAAAQLANQRKTANNTAAMEGERAGQYRDKDQVLSRVSADNLRNLMPAEQIARLERANNELLALRANLDADTMAAAKLEHEMLVIDGRITAIHTNQAAAAGRTTAAASLSQLERELDVRRSIYAGQLRAAGNDKTMQAAALDEYLRAVKALGREANRTEVEIAQLNRVILAEEKAFANLTHGSLAQNLKAMEQNLAADLQQEHSFERRSALVRRYTEDIALLRAMTVSLTLAEEAEVRAFLAKGEKMLHASIKSDHGDMSTAMMNVGMATAAPAAAFGLTTDAFGKFSQGMANVNSIVQESDENFASLTDSVLRLSDDKHIIQAPEELAKGLYQIVSAGYRGEEAMDLLRVSAKGAAAGLTSTATTTALTAQIVRAFSHDGMTANRAMDIMFHTVDKGLITFDQLAQHIGPAIQSAAMLKVPFEEVGAAIAQLTLKGLQPAVAITALNNAMLALNAPSREATLEARHLGLAWFEAEKAAEHIQKVGLVETFREIAEATGGSSAKVQLLLPGMRELRAAAALTADGGHELVKMNQEFATTMGATDRALEKQALGFEHGTDRMKAAWTKFMIGIGDNNPLLKGVGLVTDLINAMDKMPGVAKGVIGVTSGIAAAAGGLTTAVFAGGALATGVQALAAKNLGGVMGGIVSGLMAIGPALPLVATLSAGLVGLSMVAGNVIDKQEKLAQKIREEIEVDKELLVQRRQNAAGQAAKVESLKRLSAAYTEQTAKIEKTGTAEDQAKAKSDALHGMLDRLRDISPDLSAKYDANTVTFDSFGKVLSDAVREAKELGGALDALASKNFDETGAQGKAIAAKQAASKKLETTQTVNALLERIVGTGDGPPLPPSMLKGKPDAAAIAALGSADVRQALEALGVVFEVGGLPEGPERLPNIVSADFTKVRQTSAERQLSLKSAQSGVASTATAKQQSDLAEYRKKNPGNDDAARIFAQRHGIPLPADLKPANVHGSIATQMKDLQDAFTTPLNSDVIKRLGLGPEYQDQSFSTLVDKIKKQRGGLSGTAAEKSATTNEALATVKAAWDKVLADKGISHDALSLPLRAAMKEREKVFTVAEGGISGGGGGDNAYAKAAQGIRGFIDSALKQNEITDVQANAYIRDLDTTVAQHRSLPPVTDAKGARAVFGKLSKRGSAPGSGRAVVEGITGGSVTQN